MKETKQQTNSNLISGNIDYRRLDDCTFFRRLGFELSDEQKKLRDAIFNPNIDIVFVDASAGTGKTTIAVATASLLVECGKYDNILYCFSLNNGFQNTLGLLPGGVEDKESNFYEPCLQALITCGYDPKQVVKELSPVEDKNGKVFVSCKSHTFLRGTNISERTVLICDEAQNMYADELKKVLTRVKDGTKVIIIGHTGQVDIVKHPEYSGFSAYINLFKDADRCAICTLSTNFRGWISRLADSLDVNTFRKNADKNQNKTILG